MTRIGIVTGTRIEAACFAPRTAVCSGTDAPRARDVARRLVAEGCQALASVGTAGGLHPELTPGALVIAVSVVGPDGLAQETHAPWRAALAAALEGGGLSVRLAAVAGSDAAVLHVDGKRRLFERTGALCVDMESHAVAAVAAEAGVPFLAVRAVADPAHRVLPHAALASVGPGGDLRPAALLAALAARPGEIGQMVRLARDSRRALGSLRRVAVLGGPTLSLLFPLA
jgi:adenosylhomocysteine nucleosidase